MKLDLKGKEIAIIYNANSAFAKNKARQAHSLAPASKTFRATSPEQVQDVLNGLDEAVKNILEKNHPMFNWNDSQGIWILWKYCGHHWLSVVVKPFFAMRQRMSIKSLIKLNEPFLCKNTPKFPNC